MAGPPPPSIRQGVRIVPLDMSVPVEEVLLAAAEQVGAENLVFASRMNKAVVVFLKEQAMVAKLVESGVVIRDTFVQVSPLSTPSTRVTLSGVPPFIPNELLAAELIRFGKLASGIRNVNLGCKDPRLSHVQSLRRQCFMFIENPSQTLEVSFRVRHGDGSYMIYASSGQMKCFECGDVGHKRFACPHRQVQAEAEQSADPAVVAPVLSSATAAETPAGEGSAVAAAGESAVAGELVIAEPAEAVAPADSEIGFKGNMSESVGKVRVRAGRAASQVKLCDEEAAGNGETGDITDESQQPPDNDEEEMELESDEESISEGAPAQEIYSLEEIKEFLDSTYKKSVRVRDYFKDTEKFVRTVRVLNRMVSADLLDEKKRFRLKKHVTALRKDMKGRKDKK